MPNERMTNQEFVDQARAKPGANRTRYFDAEIPGLCLTVTYSGAKSFAVYYRVGGSRALKTFTLHGYPKLKDARKQAKVLQGLIADGRDPMADRRLEREAEKAARDAAWIEELTRRNGTVPGSLKAVSEDYFKHEGNNLRTGRRRKLDVDRLVMHTPLGAKHIHAIGRAEIVALLDDIKKRNGKSMASHILSYLRRILNWYQARNETYRSPIVPGMLGKRKAGQGRRKRVLSDIELRAVWRTAEELRLKDIPKSREPVAIKVFAGLVQFLLLTAARRQEGARAARHEIHGDEFLIPPQRYKTDMHLVVPLSGAAQTMLSSLPKINNKWIFATRSGKRPFGGFSNAKAEFDKAVLRTLRKVDPGAAMERWTIHDLRRTARTLMSRAKVPYDIAERCVGHTRGEMDETYNMYAFLDERREAFEALAKLIRSIVGDNVVRLRRKPSR